MGTFNHKLKHNKSTQFPRNWVFFDCESRIQENDPHTETHYLRLGVACYVRDATSSHSRQEEWYTFTTPEEFWNWIVKHCEQDRRLVIFAYNLGFDWTLVNGFDSLESRGYQCGQPFVDGSICIIRAKKASHVILAVDAGNYFSGKLEKWGELLGYPKGEVNFRTATDEQLLPYCKRDVEIVKHMMEQYREFVEENDLGVFSMTKAGQAFTAFCHKYKDDDIYIHCDKDATKLERAGYYGGRSEAYHIGKVPSGTVYHLDVNSMNPYCMKVGYAPTSLIRYYKYGGLDRVKYLIDTHCMVAKVRIKTEHPVYPVRVDRENRTEAFHLDSYHDPVSRFNPERIVFPVGHFWTYLCTPELSYAISEGHVQEVRQLAIYRKAVLFSAYVDALYKLRQKFKSENNPVWELLSKDLMNCLYGKFGQSSEKWVEGVNDTGHEDGSFYTYNREANTHSYTTVIAGRLWHSVGRREGMHSFPAISAHITSAARMLLWRLFQQAGLSNIYYTDTDSMVVNRKGYDNLQSEIDQKELGKLELKYASKSMHIYGAKDYKDDHTTKSKGIRSDARELIDGVYMQTQFRTLKGAIADGQTDRVIVKQITKVLKRDYRKGLVSGSGSVSPLLIDEV